MLQSKGTHLSILECDFLDPAFAVRSIDIFRVGKAEVIVGSKRHPDSRDRRPLKRRALTLLYSLSFCECSSATRELTLTDSRVWRQTVRNGYA